MQYDVDVAVVGGGPAGLAAALAAKEAGASEVLLVDREEQLGGILKQCIHPGFGISFFNADLTGPEYAERFIEAINRAGVKTLNKTAVLSIKPRSLTVLMEGKGIKEISAKAIVLAMGCRERTREALGIPGFRPAGVFTAGLAQRLINIEGKMIGRRIVILGSGDVGLIMARRLTLEGAVVEGVYEILPYPGGLVRNIVQCLEDYGIPLYLSHTVTFIHGNKRVEGVNVAKVDQNLQPISGSERYIPCDTLLLSVGLIPENELSRVAGIEIDKRTGGPIVDSMMQTSLSGIFACGNVLHVHDLVDNVTQESIKAGKAAAFFSLGERGKREICVPTISGKNVRYVLPHLINLMDDGEENVTFYLRVEKPTGKSKLNLIKNGETVASKIEPLARPSEMISITVNKKELSLQKGESLLFEVTEI